MKSTAEVILESIDQGAATAAIDGVVTYANARLATMVGRARRALLGMPLASLVRAEAERRRLDAVRSAAASGPSGCRVTLSRAGNAVPVPVRVSATPLSDATLWLFTDLRAIEGVDALEQQMRGLAASLGEEVQRFVHPIRVACAALRADCAGADAKASLATIERESRRLAELADDWRELR